MNRPRKKDRHLPPCVHQKHGAYYLVRRGKWQRLASDLPTALREYARLMGRSTGTMPSFIDDMLPRILKDRETGQPKAESTQVKYRQCAAILREMLKEFSPDELTARDVKAVKRELQSTPTIANRAITVLKLLMDEAVEDEIIAANPVTGVARIKTAARKRRITVAEYQRIYAHADPLLRAVMALCYATGQRVMDVATIRSEHIGDDGVWFRPQKTARRTGTEVVVAWTPELKAAVDQARALKPLALRPPYLFGFEAPTYKMIYRRWIAACKAAKIDDANIHDLRAMSATDARAQGIDPQALLGHSDAATTRIYLRDKVVPVVAGPVMRRAKG